MAEFILALLSEHDKLKSSTLYFLLNGKRTSSTLMFGYLNGLLPYFGLFKKWSQPDYHALIATLVKQNKVSLVDGLLSLGTSTAPTLDLKNYPHLAGYPWCLTDDKNWELFLFSVQVTSNLHHEIRDYRPLVTDRNAQIQLKYWLGHDLVAGGGQAAFVKEIYKGLATLSPPQAEALSAQFTGGALVGKIYGQIFFGTALEKYLQQKDTVHAWLETIKSGDFPLLQTLLFRTPDSLAESRRLIDAGANLMDLERMRRFLKVSTLRDHVLESAILTPAAFPYARFYEPATLAALEEKLLLDSPLNTWNYQDLTSPANDFLTFRLFQIERMQGGDHH